MATKFDRVGFSMLQSAYKNLWKSVVAGGVTWLSNPLLNRHGFNAPHTATFVATASLIYYAFKPFFRASEHPSHTIQTMLLRRAVFLILLTKVIADQQKLDIPFVATYVKTALWACMAIGVIHWLDKFVKKKTKGGSEI